MPRGFREVVNADHGWWMLPGDVWWFTPEFLCSAWGLGVFTSAFLIEEIESGLRSVPNGQREAALAQGAGLGGRGLATVAWRPRRPARCGGGGEAATAGEGASRRSGGCP